MNRLNTKIRLTMLCLSGFELYSRWLPLWIISLTVQYNVRHLVLSLWWYPDPCITARSLDPARFNALAYSLVVPDLGRLIPPGKGFFCLKA